MTGAKDVSTIEAQSFELRAVDGMTAYLGTLEEAEGSLVWVAGSWMDEAFSVKSFGLMVPIISSHT
jgi:hypothetical protein